MFQRITVLGDKAERGAKSCQNSWRLCFRKTINRFYPYFKRFLSRYHAANISRTERQKTSGAAMEVCLSPHKDIEMRERSIFEKSFSNNMLTPGIRVLQTFVLFNVLFNMITILEKY
jgi:hypothetical protein